MINNGSQNNNPKESLRALKILSVALVTGVVLFSLIAIVINQISDPSLPDKPFVKDIFSWGAASIAVIATVIARSFYLQIPRKLKNLTGLLNDKLNQYRSLFIRYMAFCEGPALLSVIIFLLTGNYWLLCFTGLMLLMMLVAFPGKQKITAQLALSWEEQQELE